MFGQLPGLSGRARQVTGLKVTARGARPWLAFFYFDRKLKKFVRWGDTDFGSSTQPLSDGGAYHGTEGTPAGPGTGTRPAPQIPPQDPVTATPMMPYPGPGGADTPTDITRSDFHQDLYGGGLGEVIPGGGYTWPWWRPDGYSLFNRVLGSTDTGGFTEQSGDRPYGWNDQSRFITADWRYGERDQHEVYCGISLENTGTGGTFGYKYRQEVSQSLYLTYGIGTYFQSRDNYAGYGGTPGGPGTGGGGPGGPGTGGGGGGPGSGGGSSSWGTEVDGFLVTPPELSIGAEWNPDLLPTDARIRFSISVDTEGDTQGTFGISF